VSDLNNQEKNKDNRLIYLYFFDLFLNDKNWFIAIAIKTTKNYK